MTHSSVARVHCKCDNEFQDKTYGNKVRIANATQRSAPDGKVEVRCTVCKTHHVIPKGQLK